MRLTSEQRYLRRCIIEISYKAQFSHLGSCLSAVDIISAIYKFKKRNERFVLSSGHAGIALYAALQQYGLLRDTDIADLHIHPDMNPQFGIDVSTGSLGQGLPIAAGMALADRGRDVYCLVSDGECAEGSIWEALRIAVEQKMNNLKIVINANGWGAYSPISLSLLTKRLRGFGYNVMAVNGHNICRLQQALKLKNKNKPSLIFAKTEVGQFPFLKGQDAHYYVMNKADYELALNILK
jgi:transketolase